VASSDIINAKPWLAPNAQAGSYALGLLGLEERKLLYQLARHIYTGEGAVVELGAFPMTASLPMSHTWWTSFARNSGRLSRWGSLSPRSSGAPRRSLPI
jgi:hypothetical protein